MDFPAQIDVTVPVRGQARRDFRLHHAPALGTADRAEIEGIPVTALPRTLLDIAASSPRRLPGTIERAERLGIFDLHAVEELLGRIRGHHGCGRLRRAVAAYREPHFTRSELERRFCSLIEDAGLPTPSVNAFVAGYELDVYWPRERFAVELDGYEYHRTRAAFERDRIRQEDLKLAGIEMVRITALRIANEPQAVIARLGTLLERRRSELKAVHHPAAHPRERS